MFTRIAGASTTSYSADNRCNNSPQPRPILSFGLRLRAISERYKMATEFTRLTKPMKLIVFIGAIIAFAIIYAMFYSLFSSHVILRSSVDEPDVSGSLFIYGIKISLLMLLFYSLTIISYRLWLRKLESFGIAIRNNVTGVLAIMVLLLSQVLGILVMSEFITTLSEYGYFWLLLISSSGWLL
jgi:hypothetical protein